MSMSAAGDGWQRGTHKASLRYAKLNPAVPLAISLTRSSGKAILLLDLSLSCQYWTYSVRSSSVGSSNKLSQADAKGECQWT